MQWPLNFCYQNRTERSSINNAHLSDILTAYERWYIIYGYRFGNDTEKAAQNNQLCLHFYEKNEVGVHCNR